MVNRPTTKGGTRIILLSTAMVELVLIIMAQYFPEFFTPEIVTAITTLLILLVSYGASREEKPEVQQRGATETPEPQPGITENPPIKRG